jgi:hypothetical protein
MVLRYDAFGHNTRGRLKRDGEADEARLRELLSDYIALP